MIYELVIGLEVHIELSTKTKIFCGCTTEFGKSPNTNCCPICTGMPGTLPKLNSSVVDYGIMAGLATNCEINPMSEMDRKNYVYPDLPKAYQISQYDIPLCQNGYITLSTGKKIRINRIHIEEDAGKLTHENNSIYIDYNRCGVPLIEIVTEPDMRSAEEAVECVEKLQLIMKYIGISDCKMQEGSLRCDVNISVMPKWSDVLGTRTEIKNMNSFTYMLKAIDYEFGRQVRLMENGDEITQETLRYNIDAKMTESIRRKEDLKDYRYFREPDLVTIRISDEKVKCLKHNLPEMPDVKLHRYTENLGIPKSDALLIVKYRKVAEYFEQSCVNVRNPKISANFILGQVFRRLNTDDEKENCNINIPPEYLNELVVLVDRGNINMNVAKSALEKMLDTGSPVQCFITAEDRTAINDEELLDICTVALQKDLNAVASYLNGKEKALKSIIGIVMKETKGRADAVKVQKILIKLIDEMREKHD